MAIGFLYTVYSLEMPIGDFIPLRLQDRYIENIPAWPDEFPPYFSAFPSEDFLVSSLPSVTIAP
ncbi:MAG: hypothetical protein ACOYMG_18305 [Candidatus Methylumidiphilus sp.]